MPLIPQNSNINKNIMKRIISNLLKGFLMAAFLLCIFSTAIQIVPHAPTWVPILIWSVVSTMVLTAAFYFHSKPVIKAKEVVYKRPSMSDILHFIGQHIDPDDVLELLANLDKRVVKDYSVLDSNQQIMKSEENALRERVRATANYLTDCHLDKFAKTLLRIQFGAMCIYHSSLMHRMELEAIISPEEPSSATEEGCVPTPSSSEEEESSEGGTEEPSPESSNIPDASASGNHS